MYNEEKYDTNKIKFKERQRRLHEIIDIFSHDDWFFFPIFYIFQGDAVQIRKINKNKRIIRDASNQNDFIFLFKLIKYKNM